MSLVDGILLNSWGYLLFIWSSRSKVNSTSCLEFYRTFTMGTWLYSWSRGPWFPAVLQRSGVSIWVEFHWEGWKKCLQTNTSWGWIGGKCRVHCWAPEATWDLSYGANFGKNFERFYVSWVQLASLLKSYHSLPRQWRMCVVPEGSRATAPLQSVRVKKIIIGALASNSFGWHYTFENSIPKK